MRIILISLLIFSLGASAQSPRSSGEFTRSNAHPNAAALMKEDFFWSTVDEAGPFGSDDGWEAAQGFRQWRLLHPLNTPLTYIDDLLDSWHYPIFKWDELDTTAIHAFLTTPAKLDEASIEQVVNAMKQNQGNSPKKLTDEEIRKMVLEGGKNMGIIYLVGEDEAAISTAFAQFVLEGRLNSNLKAYAEKSLQRQMLPIVLRQFGTQGQQNMRKEKLTKMLRVILQAKP